MAASDIKEKEHFKPSIQFMHDNTARVIAMHVYLDHIMHAWLEIMKVPHRQGGKTADWLSDMTQLSDSAPALFVQNGGRPPGSRVREA